MIFRINLWCASFNIRIFSDKSRQQADDSGPLPSWDDESAFGGQYDDGNVYSDVDDSSTLVSQPRQVGFIHFHLRMLLF
jgi:condensin complex subunit 2